MHRSQFNRRYCYVVAWSVIYMMFRFRFLYILFGFVLFEKSTELLNYDVGKHCYLPSFRVNDVKFKLIN